MAKKLVFREDLKYVLDELFEINLMAPSHLHDKIESLITFIDTKVLESDKELVNEAKRAFYESMKKSKSPEENKKYYNMYKDLNNLLPDCNND